jgi:hypothetical protein
LGFLGTKSGGPPLFLAAGEFQDGFGSTPPNGRAGFSGGASLGLDIVPSRGSPHPANANRPEIANAPALHADRVHLIMRPISDDRESTWRPRPRSILAPVPSTPVVACLGNVNASHVPYSMPGTALQP